MTLKKFSKSPTGLVLKLLLFVGLLLVIDNWINAQIQVAVPEDYKFAIEAKSSYDPSEKYDILIVGDSHVADALVPSIIEEETGLKAFNIAVYRSTPYENYYLLRDVLARGHTPKIVVLGTNPRMFVKEVTSGLYTPLFIENLLIKLDLLKASFDSSNIGLFTKTGSNQYLVIPYLKLSLGIQNEMKLFRHVESIDNGYLVNQKCTARSELGHPMFPISVYQREEILPEQVDHFERMIQLLEDQNVK